MSKQWLLITSILLLSLCLYLGIQSWEKRKLKEKIRKEWGIHPRGTRFDKEESLKAAWLNYEEQHPSDFKIDDITWNDLDMARVFELLNNTKSSLGAENLYRLLRSFANDSKGVAEFQEYLDFYEGDDQARSKIQYVLAKIGKRDRNQLTVYLNQPQANKLGNPWLYYCLGVAPLVLLGALIISQNSLFLLGLIANVVTNSIVYLIKKQQLERELLSMSYLVNMIALAKEASQVSHPCQGELKELSKKLKTVGKLGFIFRFKSGSESEMFLEYLNILFMVPLISYNVVINKISTFQNEALRLAEILGKTDSAIAVLNFKKIMPYTSPPSFATEGGISSQGMYHPLLSQAVANEVQWHKTTLVTGSNASGKSTYLKAVAINGILAQTIGLTCSRSWQMKPGAVLSSMALEDSLFEGDSYFVAEIKSVKRIIEKVKGQETCYCFVDEILRGTNTVERISASSAIVNWLRASQSLAFIATHDIELTELLKDHCENIHFSETVTEDQGVTFDYVLRHGPAKSRNAIQLLGVMAYPKSIIAEAENRAQHFEKTRKWQ